MVASRTRPPSSILQGPQGNQPAQLQDRQACTTDRTVAAPQRQGTAYILSELRQTLPTGQHTTGHLILHEHLCMPALLL